jgi:hypothetical protein
MPLGHHEKVLHVKPIHLSLSIERISGRFYRISIGGNALPFYNGADVLKAVMR